MKFYEILHEIINLKRDSKKGGSQLDTAWQKLCDNILADMPESEKKASEDILADVPESEKEQARKLLQEINNNFGITSSKKPELQRDEKLEKEQGVLTQDGGEPVKIHYRNKPQIDTSHANVETLLLPIVKLAYLYEKNGDKRMRKN